MHLYPFVLEYMITHHEVTGNRRVEKLYFAVPCSTTDHINGYFHTDTKFLTNCFLAFHNLPSYNPTFSVQVKDNNFKKNYFLRGNYLLPVTDIYRTIIFNLTTEHDYTKYLSFTCSLCYG